MVLTPHLYLFHLIDGSWLIQVTIKLGTTLLSACNIGSAHRIIIRLHAHTQAHTYVHATTFATTTTTTQLCKSQCDPICVCAH